MEAWVVKLLVEAGMAIALAVLGYFQRKGNKASAMLLAALNIGKRVWDNVKDEAPAGQEWTEWVEDFFDAMHAAGFTDGDIASVLPTVEQGVAGLKAAHQRAQQRKNGGPARLSPAPLSKEGK